MAQQVHDRWLWLGFGLFFVVAAKGLHYAIRETIELTKVDPSYYETEPKRQGEQPEDSKGAEVYNMLLCIAKDVQPSHSRICAFLQNLPTRTSPTQLSL